MANESLSFRLRRVAGFDPDTDDYYQELLRIERGEDADTLDRGDGSRLREVQSELWQLYAPEEWQEGRCPFFVRPGDPLPNGLTASQLALVLKGVPKLQYTVQMIREASQRMVPWARMYELPTGDWSRSLYWLKTAPSSTIESMPLQSPYGIVPKIAEALQDVVSERPSDEKRIDRQRALEMLSAIRTEWDSKLPSGTAVWASHAMESLLELLRDIAKLPGDRQPYLQRNASYPNPFEPLASMEDACGLYVLQFRKGMTLLSTHPNTMFSGMSR